MQSHAEEELVSVASAVVENYCKMCSCECTLEERGDGKGRDLLQRVYLSGKIMSMQVPVEVCKFLNFELGHLIQK